MQDFGVRKVRTSAYHEMYNGMVERFHTALHDSIGHCTDYTSTNWELCTYVNTIMEEKVRVQLTPPTVLVGHLVDGDVCTAVLTSRKEHGGQVKLSHMSGVSYT